ncbi:MAG: HTTM domain-containing protein [Kofleriaceae bacterium]
MTDRPFYERWFIAVFEPQPIVRLELVRILAPLAILAFLSSRLIHPDDWLSSAGFRLPALEGDWRQPLSLPPIPSAAAWGVAIVLALSGLATAAGALTRWASPVFAALLAYVTLADRLEAFTVSKLGTVIAIALAVSPCGFRISVDGWRRRRRDKTYVAPELCSGGSVRFFQLMLPVFYFSSGLCKASGDWLHDPLVLWSHVHDSYQTSIAWFAANHLTAWMWTAMQYTALVFEIGAPIWFGLPWTRKYALVYGIAMHTLIGLMFGPVLWFALLMISLLVASYGPIGRLRRLP